MRVVPLTHTAGIMLAFISKLIIFYFFKNKYLLPAKARAIY